MTIIHTSLSVGQQQSQYFKILIVHKSVDTDGNRYNFVGMSILYLELLYIYLDMNIYNMYVDTKFDGMIS